VLLRYNLSLAKEERVVIIQRSSWETLVAAAMGTSENLFQYRQR
jgi:hypothetical protein